jgi:hypothetical protein
LLKNRQVRFIFQKINPGKHGCCICNKRHSYLTLPKSYTLTHKKLMQDKFGVKMLEDPQVDGGIGPLELVGPWAGYRV